MGPPLAFGTNQSNIDKKLLLKAQVPTNFNLKVGIWAT